MKIANVLRINTPNVGDLSCCPADYFPIGGDRYDIEDEPVEADVLIFGGGGMLYNEQAMLAWSAKNPRAKYIAWGLGINGQCVVPRWMDVFDLLGMRDHLPAHDTYKDPIWVPCVSCMNPVFDNTVRSNDHKWVVYSHHDRAIDVSKPLHFGCGNIPLPPHTPTINNYGITMEEAVDFLASGEYVATNSYHGWYWAMLLGKPVCLTEKWSTKFMNRLYDHGSSYMYPDALYHHRQANLDFWEKVAPYVGGQAR